MIRRLLAVALMLVAGLAFLPQRSIALPPSPELSKWNEGTEPTQMVGETDAAFKIRRDAWIDAKKNRIRWNCYNYGVDVQTTGAGGKATRAHPGKGMAWPNEDSTLTAAQMCTKVLARAKADGLKDSGWKPGDPIPTPGVGQNLVALGGLAGLKSDGADYHWWRLNGDGTWSHKRGGTKAKTTYTDAGVEKPLTDPRIAGQRDGYDLCGFMFVPKAGITVGTLAAAPVCEPRDGTVLAQSVRGSGFPDPQKVLNSSEIYLLGSHLPSFSSPNEVPDPHWTEVPAGVPAGIIVTTDTDGLGSTPPYLRAYNGVVEVVLPWPDKRGEVFFADDHGLELYLDQVVYGQPSIACDTETGTVLVNACVCSDEAHGDPATATLMAMFQANAVDDGLEMRWQFGDPGQFASADLERSDAMDGPWSSVTVERRDEGGMSIALDRGVESGRTYFYRLLATTRGGQQMKFGPIAGTAGVPVAEFALARISPNPTSGPTNIDFSLSHETTVRLSVMDVMGREVAVLAQGSYRAGHYQASWSGRTEHGNAPTGFYFVRLTVPGRTFSRQLVLTR